MTIPTPEESLAWWRNVALGLKAEIVIRGNRIAELEAENEQLAQENNMLFDRAAQRLAQIKELQSQSMPVEVQPPEHVREYVAMVLEGEYSADELRFVVYNDTQRGEWLQQVTPASEQLLEEE